MTGPFRADELGPPGADDSAELASALEAARLLERSVGVDGVRPGPDFTARVMAAVASEPAPHRSRLAIFAVGLQAAWRTAFATGQPAALRARALAVVLVAVIAFGSLGGAATLAAASALNLFGPHPTPAPLVTPGPTPAPNETPPSTGPGPGVTPEPTELETPEASETPEPGETPEPTTSDDHGGGGGGGGGGDSATPRPTRTPPTTDTPEPTETPEPTQTADH